MEIIYNIKLFLKSISNIHRDEGNNVLIISNPRSGSTWLMEMIWSQNKFKAINEPLNIRRKEIAKYLGVSSFSYLIVNIFQSKNYVIIFQILLKADIQNLTHLL